VNSLYTVELPITDYQTLSNDELYERTASAKKRLGDEVLVLGHNYQRDEVIVHADLRGDSLLLAKQSSERSEYPNIVFCGVHFMAETADILSRSQQTVILPDLAAGCSMADMAAIEQVDECWDALGRILPVDEVVTPAVYVNSAADLKAFCGEHGGITCTSSNALAIMKWAWTRREKILFFPDEHHGRNTANKMGLPHLTFGEITFGQTSNISTTDFMNVEEEVDDLLEISRRHLPDLRKKLRALSRQ